MLYFAYGSNLSTARLIYRVPSATLVMTGRLDQHRLRFHKVGRDGSAKCDACFTGLSEDYVLGALYRIDPAHKKYLDQAEGLGNGYEIKQVTVRPLSGDQVQAFTYYATKTAPDIKPFHWYREHVLCGAREHCFPEEYIRRIENVVTVADRNLQRQELEMRIYRGCTP